MSALPRLIFVGLGLAAAVSVRAAPADDVRKDLLSGHYAEAAKEAQEALRLTPADEDLQILQVRALLTVGKYPEAQAAAGKGLEQVPGSVRLRWIAREAALDNGQTEAAGTLTTEIRQYVSGRPGLFRDPGNLVTFGRVALLLGADPKEVMDKVLASAEKMNPKLRDVYLARGELALDKHDFALAAKAYQAGLKQDPDDPDLHGGLARAYADGDRTAMLAELQAALHTNPRHVPSLLLEADNALDAEDEPAADRLLDQILAVNPWQPEAWAYKAVLAHLHNQPATEKVLRHNGLRFWPNNPVVDWLIGKKLAQRYRFAEALPYERQALQFDAGYLPAKTELANDLLRVGQEPEGWQMAEEVHAKDAYDVEAYNLTTLRDTMAKYSTLTDGDFEVRMPAREAGLYGRKVFALLGRARQTLTAKYGVDLVRPTYVEIFGDQKDFAVRTFGMPDIGGFLGVCFGRVVTVNGPAANSAQPTNWETVLWHEFCHVITLQMSQNKMPRWLSEGISVYEESQAEPSWGMHLTPRYREMILGGEMTPIGNLSAAFLVPGSPERLQFAYYQSSLVVDFMIGRYGIEALKAVLRDLGAGQEINAAIAAHTEALPQLEKDFTAYARRLAGQLGPQLAWDRPDPEVLEPEQDAKLARWIQNHPDNYWALKIQARRLADDRKWDEVEPVLEHFLALDPDQIGPDSAYRQLALAARARGETARERAAWAHLAERDDNAPDAYLRLMELARDAQDWPAEAANAEKYLAVNPLVATPYRFLAEADAATGQVPQAIAAERLFLQLDPPNPAQAHYQLARLLWRANDPEARRQVLQALEDAPRYREALALLLEINHLSSPGSSSSP